MQEFNKEILIYFNSLLSCKIIEKITIIFSDIPIFLVPIFLVAAWLYYAFLSKYHSQVWKEIIQRKKDLLFIFYSCVIAISINLIIQHFIKIDRPETILKWVWKLLLKHVPDASFPSDHTAISIAFLTSMFFAGYKKIWLTLIIPIILMLISRVILWVHWPFDILSWIIVGIVSVIISFKILKKLKLIQKLNDFLVKVASLIRL
jgi:membrane-associated phospholipid phosphatase